MLRPLKAIWVVMRGVNSAMRDPASLGLIVMTTTIVVFGAVVLMIVEKWRFLDAMFFAVATISTVGYGDAVPETDIGRIFTMGYIFVGIGVFVVTAATIADHVISFGKRERERLTGQKAE